MALVDDLKAAEADEAVKVAALITLAGQLEALIVAAGPGGVLSATDAQALLDQANANITNIDAAIAADQPPAPTPPPTP